MSCHFTKIFVHLLIVAAVSNFYVFKLIGWDPANTNLFNVNNRNTRKRCETCSNPTTKTIKRHSGVFMVKFEHILHFFVV